MGDDLSISNSARASFAKRSDVFGPADERLVNFLIRNDHSSTLRHAAVTFEIKAPLMVARQWWKYAIGSNHGEFFLGWNEASRRYVTMEPEFYIPNPDQWRSAPENRKQGSAEPLSEGLGTLLTHELNEMITQGMRKYEHALEIGVAPEIARGFLPAYFMYTNWWWTCSLQSVLHFLDQRLADDAQKEIQDYAIAVKDLIEPIFPVAVRSLLETMAE